MAGVIRVRLPMQLQALAGVGREIQISGEGLTSLEAVLSALETQFPMLRGTLRSPVTGERRPFIRFFAEGEDLSRYQLTTPLPDRVVSGEVALRVVGAMAGG